MIDHQRNSDNYIVIVDRQVISLTQKETVYKPYNRYSTLYRKLVNSTDIGAIFSCFLSLEELYSIKKCNH